MAFKKELLGTENPIVAVTHGGTFHCDDIFCTAFLKIIHKGKIKVIRANKIPENLPPNHIIYDIGYGEFDHHQVDAQTRPDGTKYSSFGLLFREFGHMVVPDERERRNFDESFVRSIDCADNYGDWSPLACLFSSFNPLWDSPEAQSTVEAKQMASISHFNLAVDTAETLLKVKFGAMNGNVRGRVYVLDAIKKDREKNPNSKILVLDKFAPYESIAGEYGYYFVIFPSNRGGFTACTVRDKVVKKASVEFPISWAEDLRKSPSGITFVHPAQFMISGKTVEDVYYACVESIKLASHK